MVMHPTYARCVIFKLAYYITGLSPLPIIVQALVVCENLWELGRERTNMPCSIKAL